MQTLQPSCQPRGFAQSNLNSFFQGPMEALAALGVPSFWTLSGWLSSLHACLSPPTASSGQTDSSHLWVVFPATGSPLPGMNQLGSRLEVLPCPSGM